MMKKKFLLLTMIASLAIISGCSTTTVADAEQQHKASRMTVVSSAKPETVLPAFKTFTWNSEYSRVLSAVNEQTKDDIKVHIRAEIIRYLKTKGYVYQPDSTQADVVIGFLFALEDDLADQRIQDKFGLLPGVNKNGISDKRYEKGTFLLAVLDRNVEVIYWRSAMQGFVDFEKDRNDESTDYLQAVLDLMMSDFPKAGR